MTLKTKISLLIASLFTIVFGIAVIVIYMLFANFRKEEFESRLKEQAVSSIKLLVEVKEIDKQLLKIIDQNSINKLYNEKTLIFDADYNLIYSSIDDTKINWKNSDLDYLKKNKTFFKIENLKETYGFFYDTNEKDYYALVSASDDYGKRKLRYLLFILISTYIFFTSITWAAVFYSVKRLLRPLVDFHHRLKGINEKNMDTRIIVKDEKDEIDLLASEFNRMLHRIDESYQKQKEFTSHASHELRTPVARVTAQLENKLYDTNTDVESKQFFIKLLSDINQLSDLISSLLLLSKLENDNFEEAEVIRIDELVFEATAKLNKIYPDFKVILDIDSTEEMDQLLEIKGNKSLLEIAFINLLKNACLYSPDKQANVDIKQYAGRLVLSIKNKGQTLSEEEQKRIFQPFMRGKNSRNKAGLGLGLRIVQRILHQHHTYISYLAPNEDTNIFNIQF